MSESPGIECDICRRSCHPDGPNLPFLCAVDARNQLYEARLRSVQALIENESYRTKVTATESSGPSPSQLEDERTLAEAATAQIREASDELKTEVNDMRDVIRERRAALVKRKEHLSQLRRKEAKQKPELVGSMEKDLETVEQQWAYSAEELARARSHLCSQVAALNGLKRLEKVGGRHTYSLGRVPVVDLSNMNSLEPEAISASLANICHLLMLASHYLSVRLPAQIILPKKDHPHPTVFNLASSYGPLTQKPTSYATGPASLHGSREMEAPGERPLFLTRPLTQLARDDPPAYKSFLEGVTLLAYDVAWLCTSQGIPVFDASALNYNKGTSSSRKGAPASKKGASDLENEAFEGICQTGRNLYHLLILQQPIIPPIPSSILRNEQQQRPQSTNGIGRYAHGSTYRALVSPDGESLFRAAQLPPPLKLADRLRRKLMGDAPDWELLDDDAWKMDDESAGTGAQPKSASQGWMKVKSRT